MRGVTRQKSCTISAWLQFQLTRLMRGVTGYNSTLPNQQKFQLTRLMRGVTPAADVQPVKHGFQLTRLMRGVTIRTAKVTTLDRISTHTPHARRDETSRTVISEHGEFQLTRLMRGVTSSRNVTNLFVKHFNSHASCEA